MTAGPSPDRAQIVALPPLIFLGALAIGLVLERWVPSTLGWRGALLPAGVGTLVAGAALGIWGDVSMKRAGTSPLPWKPTQAIVDHGPYAWTRNPLYLAQALMQVGIALAVDSWWALLWVIPALVVVRYGVIGPEERYLSDKFGERYLSYTRRVRRWVGRTRT